MRGLIPLFAIPMVNANSFGEMVSTSLTNIDVAMNSFLINSGLTVLVAILLMIIFLSEFLNLLLSTYLGNQYDSHKKTINNACLGFSTLLILSLTLFGRQNLAAVESVIQQVTIGGFSLIFLIFLGYVYYEWVPVVYSALKHSNPKSGNLVLLTTIGLVVVSFHVLFKSLLVFLVDLAANVSYNAATNTIVGVNINPLYSIILNPHFTIFPFGILLLISATLLIWRGQVSSDEKPKGTGRQSSAVPKSVQKDIVEMSHHENSLVDIVDIEHKISHISEEIRTSLEDKITKLDNLERQLNKIVDKKAQVTIESLVPDANHLKRKFMGVNKLLGEQLPHFINQVKSKLKVVESNIDSNLAEFLRREDALRHKDIDSDQIVKLTKKYVAHYFSNQNSILVETKTLSAKVDKDLKQLISGLEKILARLDEQIEIGDYVRDHVTYGGFKGSELTKHLKSLKEFFKANQVSLLKDII